MPQPPRQTLLTTPLSLYLIAFNLAVAVAAASAHPLAAAPSSYAEAEAAADDDAFNADLLATVKRFAEAFLIGDAPRFGDEVTDQVRAALSTEQVLAIRRQVSMSHGAIQSLGPISQIDAPQGYRGFIGRVEFERNALDLRIAVDGNGQIAGVNFVPPREPYVRPAEATDWKTIELKLGEPGIPGILELPQGDGPFPAVLLVHGSGPNDRDGTVGPNTPLKDLAWGLLAHGVAVLRYDKRTRVDAGLIERLDGPLTVREEVLLDVWAGMDWLRGREEVQADQLYVIGHSLGASLLPRIAEREPRPAGVVSLAGLTVPLPETILRQVEYNARDAGDLDDAKWEEIDALRAQVAAMRQALNGERKEAPNDLVGMSFAYIQDFEARDIPALAAELEVPIFVVHAGRDFQVVMDSYRRWEGQLRGKPFACLNQYPMLDHLLREGTERSTAASYQQKTGPVSKQLIDDIAGWILKRDCPDPTLRK